MDVSRCSKVPVAGTSRGITPLRLPRSRVFASRRGDGHGDHELLDALPPGGEEPVQRGGDHDQRHVVHGRAVLVGELVDLLQAGVHGDEAAARPGGLVERDERNRPGWVEPRGFSVKRTFPWPIRTFRGEISSPTPVTSLAAPSGRSRGRGAVGNSAATAITALAPCDPSGNTVRPGGRFSPSRGPGSRATPARRTRWCRRCSPLLPRPRRPLCRHSPAPRRGSWRRSRSLLPWARPACSRSSGLRLSPAGLRPLPEAASGRVALPPVRR